jgi:hypothetical protein
MPIATRDYETEDAPPLLAAQQAPLDLSAPVCTRDGDPARIIQTNAEGSRPLGAEVTLPNGTIAIRKFTLAGKFSPATGLFPKLDLVNVGGLTTVEAQAEWATRG